MLRLRIDGSPRPVAGADRGQRGQGSKADFRTECNELEKRCVPNPAFEMDCNSFGRNEVVTRRLQPAAMVAVNVLSAGAGFFCPEARTRSDEQECNSARRFAGETRVISIHVPRTTLGKPFQNRGNLLSCSRDTTRLSVEKSFRTLTKNTGSATIGGIPCKMRHHAGDALPSPAAKSIPSRRHFPVARPPGAETRDRSNDGWPFQHPPFSTPDTTPFPPGGGRVGDGGDERLGAVLEESTPGDESCNWTTPSGWHALRDERSKGRGGTTRCVVR